MRMRGLLAQLHPEQGIGLEEEDSESDEFTDSDDAEGDLQG
jgi:hypothetical protein